MALVRPVGASCGAAHARVRHTTCPTHPPAGGNTARSADTTTRAGISTTSSSDMVAADAAAGAPTAQGKPVFFPPSAPPAPPSSNRFFAWPPPPAPTAPALAPASAVTQTAVRAQHAHVDGQDPPFRPGAVTIFSASSVPTVVPAAAHPTVRQAHDERKRAVCADESPPFQFGPDMTPAAVYSAPVPQANQSGAAAIANDTESPFQFNPAMLSSPASSRSSITSSSQAGDDAPPLLHSARFTYPLPPRPPTRYAHSSPPRRSDSDDLFSAPPPILSPGQQTFTDLTPGSFHHRHSHTHHHLIQAAVTASKPGHARSYSTPFVPHAAPKTATRALSPPPASSLPVPGPGLTRDVTHGFLRLRAAAMAQPERKAAALDLQRRVRRWEKLVALHQGAVASRSPWWLKAALDMRSSEKQLVPWVPDDVPEARQCALCAERFSLRTRRHHCRLCGRCVCGATRTGCSQLLRVPDLVQAPPPLDGMVTRLCSACCSSIRAHLASAPPDWVIAHSSLVLLETEITRLLREYQAQLTLVAEHASFPPRKDDAVASPNAALLTTERCQGQQNSGPLQTRSLLLLHCDMYDQLARSLCTGTDSDSDTRRVLQAMGLRARHFLEDNVRGAPSLEFAC